MHRHSSGLRWSAERETHLNCWCSLEQRILEENLSANFSKLREYSSSISALRRKNSCRSCSSWIRDSDCCSKHLNCSTSWLRISGYQEKEETIFRIWGAGGACALVLTLCIQHSAHSPLEVKWSKYVYLRRSRISNHEKQSCHNWIKLNVKVHLSTACMCECMCIHSGRESGDV